MELERISIRTVRDDRRLKPERGPRNEAFEAHSNNFNNFFHVSAEPMLDRNRGRTLVSVRLAEQRMQVDHDGTRDVVPISTLWVHVDEVDTRASDRRTLESA